MIEIRSGDTPVTIESRDGVAQVWLGPAVFPDLIITGPPEGIIAVLMQTPTQAAAKRQGVSIQRRRTPVCQASITLRPCSTAARPALSGPASALSSWLRGRCSVLDELGE